MYICAESQGIVGYGGKEGGERGPMTSSGCNCTKSYFMRSQGKSEFGHYMDLQNADDNGPYTAYTLYFRIFSDHFRHFGGPPTATLRIWDCYVGNS